MDTYIFDLDGTLGIFDEDGILLRPGLREAFAKLTGLNKRLILASKGSPDHVFACGELLKAHGANFEQVLSCADVYVKGHTAFKRYDKVSFDPKTTAIVGDLLRGPSGTATLDYYANLDFEKDAGDIFEASGLSDNPVPNKEGTPVYLVVPQVHTERDGRVQTLSLKDVIDAYESGQFERVRSSTFAERSYGQPFSQEYGFFKNLPVQDVELVSTQAIR